MSNLSKLKTELTNSYKKAKSENQKAVNEYLKALNDSYNKQLSNYKNQIAAQKAAVPRNYTDDYDLNAINRLINERKLKERMASLGLTDSGANQTLRAGIDIAKQNADNLVTMQKNREINGLSQEYNKQQQALSTELNNKKAAAIKSFNDKNASLISTLTSKYNDAVKAYATKQSSNSSTSNLISIYNKLTSMDSPNQQYFYIQMLHDDGVLNNEQVKRLKERLGLDYYY